MDYITNENQHWRHNGRYQESSARTQGEYCEAVSDEFTRQLLMKGYTVVESRKAKELLEAALFNIHSLDVIIEWIYFKSASKITLLKNFIICLKAKEHIVIY